MGKSDYRRPAEKIDMAVEERAIRRDTSVAILVTVAAYFGAYRLLPRVFEFPQDVAHALGLAAIVWAVPALILMIAILMVSTGRRYSAADIGGQAAGPPSETLAVRAAFLQNTLEQTVLAAGFYFALAALARGPWLALLPAAAALFVVGRTLFFFGYTRGAKGRSLGMGLTMLPSAVGYLVLLWLLLFGA